MWMREDDNDNEHEGLRLSVQFLVKNVVCIVNLTRKYIKIKFYLDPMISKYTYMHEEVRKYLVSFGATVNHAVPAEGLRGGEGLGTH